MTALLYTSRAVRSPAALMSNATAGYLRPYVDAHRRRWRGARALLWDDRRSQEVRFDAIARNCPLAGMRILDVGCGRADLLAFLLARGIVPAEYVGLEAQPWLVRAARRRGYESCAIVEGDFVREPAKLRIGADVIVFSGSLNLLSSRQFYRHLDLAWAAAGRWLAFNFLCSPALADADWLTWHRRTTVRAFARRAKAAEVRLDDGYEDGDCTVVMRKARKLSRRAPVNAGSAVRRAPSATGSKPPSRGAR